MIDLNDSNPESALNKTALIPAGRVTLAMILMMAAAIISGVTWFATNNANQTYHLTAIDQSFASLASKEAIAEADIAQLKLNQATNTAKLDAILDEMKTIDGRLYDLGLKGQNHRIMP